MAVYIGNHSTITPALRQREDQRKDQHKDRREGQRKENGASKQIGKLPVPVSYHPVPQSVETILFNYLLPMPPKQSLIKQQPCKQSQPDQARNGNR